MNHLGVENSNPRNLYVKKTRFSESQIVAILKEVELGAKVGETCRKRGVSDANRFIFNRLTQPKPISRDALARSWSGCHSRKRNPAASSTASRWMATTGTIGRT
ncbi:MAG: transposase [Brachymonas sp.]|nr:transposase [Brachymonas sp.]